MIGADHRIYAARPAAAPLLRAALTSLSAVDHDALIWGGSTTMPGETSGFVDIDLWLVVANPSLAATEVRRSLSRVPAVQFVFESGCLPWLGELTSAFFYRDWSFAIDVGAITRSGLAEANPGPNPVLLWGDSTALRLLRPHTYAEATSKRLERTIVNAMKVRKAIVRGEWWNAMECLMRARRELMGLKADRIDAPRIRYRRVERGIERLLSKSDLQDLADTSATLSGDDLARALGVICRLALVELQRTDTAAYLLSAFQEVNAWAATHTNGDPTRNVDA